MSSQSCYGDSGQGLKDYISSQQLEIKAVGEWLLWSRELKLSHSLLRDALSNLPCRKHCMSETQSRRGGNKKEQEVNGLEWKVEER